MSVVKKPPICTCLDGSCKTCRAIRARIARENPACIHCGQPCVAGQTDASGRSAHYCCQARAQ